MRIGKGKYIVPIILVSVMIFTGCFWIMKIKIDDHSLKVSREIGATSTETISPILHRDSTVGMLTKEQALADYTYMWDVLERNYPSFSLAERKQPLLNKERSKELGELLIKQSKDMSLLQFYEIASNTLVPFGEVFHLSLVSPEFYFHSVLPMKEAAHLSTMYINDVNFSNQTYTYLSKVLSKQGNVDLSSQYVNEKVSHKVATSDVPSFEIVNEDTALITIPTFALDNQTERLVSYFEQAKSYKNLIIDISQNVGGSDKYWKEGIVAPNTAEELVYPNEFLINGGHEVKAYLTSSGLDIERFGLLLKQQEELQINIADKDELDMLFQLTTTISSATGKKEYTGNIYVLIDKPVFSASESFAMFCKSTGFATLVGRNSYGDGNGITPMTFSMPESGLIFRFSVLYTLNNDGTANQELGTTPDYQIEGYETPLKAALRVIAIKELQE